MKIVLDAMGGDNAPYATVEGALMYAKESNEDIILVGKEDIIKEIIKEKLNGEEMPKNITIQNATEEIVMEDVPTKAIKTKKDSSMVVSLKKVKDGEADVVVSAGNTGALLAGAILILGRIKGVKRPAMLATLPSYTDKLYFIDAGANTNCDEKMLMQFAQMASIYVEKVRGISNPKVGLLNIGEEDIKGSDFYKKVYEYFNENYEKEGINFSGNIEPNRAIMGEVNIAVADGFTGNIMIKSMEGVFKIIKLVGKDLIKDLGLKKIFLLPIKNDAKKVFEKYNYKKESAGAFLGIKKPLVKTHGNSDAKSFYYALKQAERYAKADVITTIEDKINK